MLWQYLARDKEAGAHCDAPEPAFLGLCVAHFSMSSAQLMHLYVLWKLRQKRGGYFVDFGATDGLSLSNAYLLERSFGWTGIVAEPNPTWHKRPAKNRTANVDGRCVRYETGARLNLAALSAPEYSTVRQFADQPQQKRYSGQNIPVKAVSLRNLLSTHRAPSAILKKFELSHRFHAIAVEHNFNKMVHEGIRQLLTARAYARQFEDFSRLDDWY